MAKEKLNWEDEQVRHTYRHTASHIMAQAIQHLWPDTKFATDSTMTWNPNTNLPKKIF